MKNSKNIQKQIHAGYATVNPLLQSVQSLLLGLTINRRRFEACVEEIKKAPAIMEDTTVLHGRMTIAGPR